MICIPMLTFFHLAITFKISSNALNKELTISKFSVFTTKFHVRKIFVNEIIQDQDGNL